ncbi:MAG: hypothetical protein Q27BB25_14800 [Blastomonas sp. CACIA14H2]|nr:MAG: hypothetical protein Q27BB25_14800 [Blastomonas sp. CACIA14H2]
MEMPADVGIVQFRVDPPASISAGDFAGLVTAFATVLETDLNRTARLEDDDWVALIDSVDAGSYIVRFKAAAKREWEDFRKSAAEMAGLIALPENRLVRYASVAAIGDFALNLAAAIASLISNQPPLDPSVATLCSIVVESGATVTVSGSGCPPVTINPKRLAESQAFQTYPLPDEVRKILASNDIYVSENARIGVHREMVAYVSVGAGRRMTVIDEAGRRFDAAETMTSNSAYNYVRGHGMGKLSLVVQPVYDQGRIACLFIRTVR